MSSKKSYKAHEVRHSEGMMSMLNDTLDIRGSDKHGDIVNIHLTTRQEQLKATYSGALPGLYYRSADEYPRSSEGKVEKRYPSCDGFEVLPGEQLTFIVFNVPRFSPESALQNDEANTTGIADTMQFLKKQHGLFFSNIYTPSVDIGGSELNAAYNDL